MIQFYPLAVTGFICYQNNMGTKVEWRGGYPFVKGINAPRSESQTPPDTASLPIKNQPPVEL